MKVLWEKIAVNFILFYLSRLKPDVWTFDFELILQMVPKLYPQSHFDP